jgi:iduronate 2-sulfatase
MQIKKQKLNAWQFIQVSFAVIAASFFTGCESEEPKEKPNILFIAVDDLRPELGCYGNTYVKSPNIDRLAKQGVTFSKAYCQSAVCNPSRASLLTGYRPDAIKVWDLKTNFRETTPDVVTLPQHFKNSGYFSTAIGKIYHNVIPDDQSWSETKLHIDGYPFDPDAVYRDEKNVASLEKRKKQIIAEGKEKKYIDRIGEWYLKDVAAENPDITDNEYFDGAQTDVAIKKLSELKSKKEPFFFAIGYYRPHLPFNAPKKYWDMYDREQIPLAENDFLPKNSPLMAINNLRELRGYTDFRNTPKPHEGKLSVEAARLLKHGYLASVSYIDAQVGRLLDELERLDLADNTIIVLWGDHGWKLGEHNSWAKMTNYEIDTRVPLIISDPRLETTSVTCDRLVEFVDVYPTLCDLADLTLPKHLEGISTVPLMNNPNLKWKSAVFSQFLREGIWLAPDGIEYMGYAIRTENYRYVRWINWETKEFAAEELYDQKADPGENENIAGNPENSEIVKMLSEKLDAGWKIALP